MVPNHATHHIYFSINLLQEKVLQCRLDDQNRDYKAHYSFVEYHRWFVNNFYIDLRITSQIKIHHRPAMNCCKTVP